MKQNVIDQLRKAIRDSGQTQLAISEATGIGQGIPEWRARLEL